MRLVSKVLSAAALLLPAAVLTSGTVAAASTPCAGLPELPSASCGSVDVPLDRADPAAGSTTVAYALISRRDTASASEGTLLFNPGGPGDAPIEHAADIAAQFAPLLEKRDLLLVDPRGTGRSEPQTCPAFRRDLDAVFASSSTWPPVAGACGRQLGARSGRYGSAEVADDFDAVRSALGVERLDLWGNSYGAYLMPVYAARHPEHVRSMVLSSSYPMDFDPFGRDRLAAARDGLRIVCARTQACDGDAVLRDVAALARQLRRHPETFTVPVGDRRFRARLDEGALAPLLYTAGHPYAFGILPGLVASARAGDLDPLRRALESELLRNAYGAIHDPTGSEGLAAAYATMCHDYPQAFSPADPPAARRAAYDRAIGAIDPGAFYPLSGAAWTTAGFEGGETCIEWPADPAAGPPIAPGTPMPTSPCSFSPASSMPTRPARPAARSRANSSTQLSPRSPTPATSRPTAARARSSSPWSLWPPPPRMPTPALGPARPRRSRLRRRFGPLTSPRCRATERPRSGARWPS